MRILFWVRVGNKFGSMEKYILNFAEQCKQQGHSFLLLNEIENTNEEYQGRLRSFGSIQNVIGQSSKEPIRVLFRVLRIIKEWKPDIVQLYFVNSLVIPFLRISGSSHIYQTYLSGIDHKIHIKTRVIRMLDNWFATRIFSVSERVRKDEIRAGVNSSRIQTMYMGIPLQEYKNVDLTFKGRYPIGWNNPSLKKIISVGRFYPEKGVRYVVEAAIKVMKQRQDIVWWLVGQEGPESEMCLNMIRDAKMEDRIDYLGLVDDVLPFIKRSYVQVVGSLFEGLPFVPLETSACGVPTIGTNIGGMDEAIINGVTGILVERKSSQALAEATIWMLDHPEQRDKMGISAKNYIIENFDSEKRINQLLDLFEKDLNTKT